MNEIIGKSSWTFEIRKAIARVAARNCAVLIEGPTGTGKELIARAIHAQSHRHDGPFVPVNCATVPPGLCASQFFGHVKGAFSGAEEGAPGSFRGASGGTIFLDEIGELRADLEAQLLRVIEEETVTPVGDFREISIDVRVVAATNRDLQYEVQAGNFRSDLYYRLNVAKLTTAPLSSRVEDIPLLCHVFLAHRSAENGAPARRLSAGAVKVLMAHDWPGNVRELQNVLERVIVFSDGEEISAAQILEALAADGGPAIAGRIGAGTRVHDGGECGTDAWPRSRLRRRPLPTLAESESRLIRKALRRTSNNQRDAARTLGIDPRQLSRKMRKYGISVPRRLARAA